MAVLDKPLGSPVLVGRTREMQVLEAALRAAQNGAGHCILLAGEAGIGKSRLVAELRARAAPFTIWPGHCFEQDMAFPYAPWIDALCAFLAAKSATETAELLGSLSSEFKLLPELSLLIPGTEPTSPLGPTAEKHRLFESLARLSVSIAASHPLLLILEDLHWSDEPSLELLRFFARRIAALSILLIGTYRDDETSPGLAQCLAELNRDRLVEEIRLLPLTRNQVAHMARAILPPEHFLTADWLYAFMPLTEGNPFFVQELLKSQPATGEFDRMQIPRSIQDSVQRRVGQLAQRTRDTLCLAAVVGERFDFGMLQELLRMDEPELVQVVKELVSAQLLVEESADQLAFRHALTREAVYASLLKRERKAIHQRIGETLE